MSRMTSFENVINLSMYAHHTNQQPVKGPVIETDVLDIPPIDVEQELADHEKAWDIMDDETDLAHSLGLEHPSLTELTEAWAKWRYGQYYPD